MNGTRAKLIPCWCSPTELDSACGQFDGNSPADQGEAHVTVVDGRAPDDQGFGMPSSRVPSRIAKGAPLGTPTCRAIAAAQPRKGRRSVEQRGPESEAFGGGVEVALVRRGFGGLDPHQHEGGAVAFADQP